MQKFKVSALQIGRLYRKYGSLGMLPDEVILEGELLEGGTVGKCQHGPEALGCVFCHNKENEKCPHGVCGYGCAICFEDDGTATSFNRETPKKEVQVPEKIKPSRDVDWELGDKINQILDYLASRE